MVTWPLRIVSITKQNYLTIKHTNMEASEVGKNQLSEDFCPKFSGAGVKGDSRFHWKCNRQNWQVRWEAWASIEVQELLMNMEGACIDYESKLLETKSKSLNQKLKEKAGCNGTETNTHVHLHVYSFQ